MDGWMHGSQVRTTTIYILFGHAVPRGGTVMMTMVNMESCGGASKTNITHRMLSVRDRGEHSLDLSNTPGVYLPAAGGISVIRQR